jgi:superfamily II DNA or RNA helicase
MYAFQVQALEACRDKGGSLLVKAATGAGKSWLSLEYASDFGRPILVLTKANVVSQFAGETRRFYTGCHTAVLRGETPHAIPPADVVVIGHPVVDSWRDTLIAWVQKHRATVIVDEVHELASHKRWEATNTIEGDTLWKRLNNRAASAEDVCAAASVVIGLSATPQRKGRPSLWGVLRTLFGETQVPNYRAWCAEFCRFEPGEYGGKVYVGGRNTDKLRSFVRSRTVTITKDQLAAEIPPLTLETRRLELGGQYTRGITQEFRAAARKAVKEGPQAMLELRIAEAAYRKRTYVVEEAVRHADAGMNVAVAVNRVEECKALATLIRSRVREVGGKAPVHVYHGGLGQKTREDAQKRFMDTSKSGKVFVFTQQAGGTGLNLDNAHVAYIAALPTTPALLIQLTGRFHRASTKHPVRIEFILADNTIDERLGELLLPRLEDVSDLLEDAEAQKLGRIVGLRSEEEIQKNLLASLGLA